MSLLLVTTVAVGLTLNAAAVICLVRGRGETSPAKIRAHYVRARSLAVAVGFWGFVAAVAGTVSAFRSVEELSADQQARALGDGISQSMNYGGIGIAMALPAVAIAVLLARRVKAAERNHAVQDL